MYLHKADYKAKQTVEMYQMFVFLKNNLKALIEKKQILW